MVYYDDPVVGQSLGNACPDGTHPAGDYSEECIPDTPSAPATSECPPEKPYMYEGYCQKCPPGQWNHNNVCEPIGSTGDDDEARTAPKSTSSAPAPQPAPLNDNFSSQSIWDRTGSLWDELIKSSTDLKPRWNKDNLALVKGQLRQATSGNSAAEKKAYLAQRAAMGMAKQGSTRGNLRAIDTKANSEYASGATGVDVRAVGENFNDQLAILDNKRNNIIQYGQFQLALAGSDQQAASIRNSMSIALAQLAQQRQNLLDQLSMQKYLAQLGLAGNLFGSAA